MSDPVNSGTGRSAGGAPELPLGYEPPRLTPIGHLHDLLAGPGSQPCDSTGVSNGSLGASGPVGTPDQCGPSG
jgi:hypothetical protein